MRVPYSQGPRPACAGAISYQELLVKRKKLRFTLAGMTALTAVASGTLISPGGALASPKGSSIGISTTNGTNIVMLPGGKSLSLSVPVSDGAWSNDGSRMAFISNGAVEAVRFD